MRAEHVACKIERFGPPASLSFIVGYIVRFDMSKKKQSDIGFLSFFKLNLLYGVTLGQLAGAYFLALGIFGLPVHLNLGTWHIEGLPAGIGGMVLLPPAFGIVSFAI